MASSSKRYGDLDTSIAEEAGADCYPRKQG
jgi:hypothetical protein